MLVVKMVNLTFNFLLASCIRHGKLSPEQRFSPCLWVRILGVRHGDLVYP